MSNVLILAMPDQRSSHLPTNLLYTSPTAILKFLDLPKNHDFLVHYRCYQLKLFYLTNNHY